MIALDPGLRPGIVELDSNTGRLLRATHHLQDALQWAPPGAAPGGVPWDLAASEEQWLFEDSRASPRTLFSLARRAGFQLAQFPAARYMFLPPKVWRGNTCADKVVVQNRIAGTLSPEERRIFAGIPKSRHGDVLDSIGIGRAALAARNGAAYDFRLHP